jgi:hypothetical protein
MSNEDKVKLEAEMRTKVLGQMSSQTSFADLVLFTLDNFTHRYFKTETSVTYGPKIEDGREFVVRSTEKDAKEALKAANPETKSFLIELAKKAGKKEIEVSSTLKIRILDQNSNGGGVFLISAEVDFSDQKVIKEETCEFEDIIEVRNKLAFYLEKVCEVF